MSKICLLLYSFIIGCFSSISGLHSDTAAVISEVIRYSNGQLNFIDYSIHFPFLTALILNLFSKLINVTFAYVIFSGFFNLLFALIVFNICDLYNNKFSKLISFISASWFIPTIGGYYYDNFAVVMVLFIFLLNIKLKKNLQICAIITGILCFFSILIKQSTAMALIIPLYIYIYLNSNILSFIYKCLYSLFGFLISLLLVIIYLEQIKEGYSIIYFEGIYQSSLVYSDNTNRLSFENLIRYIIFPYGVNIFINENKFSMGLLLFIPVVILQYMFYFSYFFLKDIDYKYLFIFIFVGTILTQFIVGRGAINLTYFIGLQLLCLSLMKK